MSNYPLRLDFCDNGMTVGYIDSVLPAITGWIATTRGDIIECNLDHKEATYGLRRDDVRRTLNSNYLNAELSGFSCNFVSSFLKEHIRMQLTLATGEILSSQTFKLDLPPGGINRDILLSRISETATVLEISPFANPMRNGKNISYFDVLSSNELRERAAQIPGYNPNAVPEKIHFVSKNGDLGIVDQNFDFILSSHVIEHTTDLITHFLHVESILKNRGQYICIVPDKRYTFDYYKPETTLADALDAHYSRPQAHSLRTLVLNNAFSTHNDPGMHWQGDHGDIENCIQNAMLAVKLYKSSTMYVDCHNWIFTPSSFIEVFNYIAKMGYSKLKVVEFYTTVRNSNEFYVVFEKNVDY